MYRCTHGLVCTVVTSQYTYSHVSRHPQEQITALQFMNCFTIAKCLLFIVTHFLRTKGAIDCRHWLQWLISDPRSVTNVPFNTVSREIPWMWHQLSPLGSQPLLGQQFKKKLLRNFAENMMLKIDAMTGIYEWDVLLLILLWTSTHQQPAAIFNGQHTMTKLWKCLSRRPIIKPLWLV